MPVVTIDCTSGTPYHDGAELIGGGTKWDAMNDSSDATYWRQVISTSVQQTCLVDALPGNAATITSVDGNSRLRINASATSNARLYLASGTYTQFRSSTDASFTTYTGDSISRPGGGSWGDISDWASGTPQLGWANGGSVGDYAFIAELSCDVTYVPTAGGSYWLLSMWVPPLLSLVGANISFGEILPFLKAESQKWGVDAAGRSNKVRPTDRQDWDWLRSGLFRRPKFCFMGA